MRGVKGKSGTGKKSAHHCKNLSKALKKYYQTNKHIILKKKINYNCSLKSLTSKMKICYNKITKGETHGK